MPNGKSLSGSGVMVRFVLGENGADEALENVNGVARGVLISPWPGSGSYIV